MEEGKERKQKRKKQRKKEREKGRKKEKKNEKERERRGIVIEIQSTDDIIQTLYTCASAYLYMASAPLPAPLL